MGIDRVSCQIVARGKQDEEDKLILLPTRIVGSEKKPGYEV